MARSLIGQLVLAFKELTPKLKVFIILAFASAFLISADYSIIRPASNSVFITAYGSALLPYAWLAAIPFNFILVSLYNLFLPKIGNHKLILITIFSIVVINTFFSFILKTHPKLSFFYYIWKEVYILLMFQQLWSEIHAHFNVQKAKYFYGAMYGMGALGSTFGSLVPSFFAMDRGSETLLLATLPIYLLLAAIMTFLFKGREENASIKHEDFKSHPLAGLKLILTSKPLIAILSIVVFMQVASTLADFQLNTLLAEKILNTDARTQVNAKIMSYVHSCTLIFQFVGSYLIIEWLGVKRGHIAIPLILLLNTLFFVFSPNLFTASLCYIAIKSLDFSLFSVLKEMLYVPLKVDEKYRAKSFIDVFAYRGSKSIASLLILVLQAAFASHVMPVLSVLSALLFVAWILCISLLLKEHSKKAVS